jgi:hypothetical protein
MISTALQRGMLTEHPGLALQLGHCHSHLRSGTALLGKCLPWRLEEHRADMCMMLEDTTGHYNQLDMGKRS